MQNIYVSHESRRTFDENGTVLLAAHLQPISLAEHVVFNDYNDSCFNKAVETITNESLVGIDVKATNSGHHHEVTLLNISTKTCVYQFYTLKLGMAAFDAGLRSILESKMQKVIHNSRLHQAVYITNTLSG
jgi:hypothetical protein